MKRLSILVLLTLIVYQTTFAQDADTTVANPEKKEYRNTFRWNMTPQLLWGGTNFVFGFERKLSSHRSFSINAGHLTFPKLISEKGQLINIISTTKSTGFSYAFDYRFYAKKRNKEEAPDGLYWAPFFVSYNYKIENRIELLDDTNVISSTADLATEIHAFNMGIELGYQLVFKERFALDLILIGPAFGYYKAKFDLDSSIQLKDEYLQAIKDVLANRIPLLGKLMEGTTVETDGSLSTLKPGFRYVLQIGYRF